MLVCNYNYKKTQLDSPLGMFIAKQDKETGLFHIFWKPGKQLHPMFTYNVKSNRFIYTGGIGEISPEALQDLANFGASIYDNQ